MPREKLVRLDIDDGRKSRRETEKRQSDDEQAQRLQRKLVYLYGGEKNAVNEGGKTDEIPKERKNSKNRKARIQQEAAEERGKKKMEMMQENKQANKKEADSTSDASSSSYVEFAVDLMTEEELEELMEAIDEKKELVATLKAQPWSMHKKMSTLSEAQAFIQKYEGTLGKVKGKKLYACKVAVMKKWMRFQRHFHNFKKACIPWEMKIKEIESHFGSSVASYFILLRWMFGVNIILFALSVGLMLPEALLGLPYGSIPRKTVPRQELSTALNLDIVWDLEGYVKYSVLFYGYYNNQRTIGWMRFRMPLCYLLVVVVSVVYSYVEIIRIMTRNASRERDGDDTHFNYSWKIFTSWDYLVGNSETADNKFASIATTFKETLIEEKELRKDENPQRTLLCRILANIMVLVILVGSMYLTYFVVHRSEKFFRAGMKKFNWWERNEVNAVMSLLGTFCPMAFEAISLMEHHHPRTTINLQLVRIFALYVGNLYSFVVAVIEQLNLSSVEEEETKRNLTIWEANMYNRSIAENSTTFRVDPADVPRGPCWETVVGQEFVRMVVSDTLTVYIVLMVNDFLRAVVIRFLNRCWCWDLEFTFPGYSLFDLSGNVLTLIFNQGMIWMGTLFAPCLPALNLIRLQTSMYLQAWCVLCSNVPHEHICKASRSSNFYMKIQLFILFASTLPTIFTIVSMRPSFDCGPFSGKEHMYDVIPETLELDFPKWIGNVLRYIFNPGLVVPFLLLMVLLIYYLYTTTNNYKQAHTDLKDKLQAQTEENRNWSKLEARKSAEYLEQAKKMAALEQQDIDEDEDEDKQSNNSVSGNVRHSRPSAYVPPPPPNMYSGDQGSSFKYSRRPTYTRPPAPRSHLPHGQLPGFPPY